MAPYTTGAVLSAGLIGKVGSAPNYLLELSVALSLAVGALVAWHHRRHWVQTALILVVAVQVFGMVQWWSDMHLSYDSTTDTEPSTTDTGPFALWLPSDVAEIERVNEIIREAKGTVLTDVYIGLLPLNGQQIYCQPFELNQLARNGRWDQRPFLQALDEGEFAAVLIRHDDYWTPEMRERINERYESVEKIGDIVVYRAK
ncbi:MAG: hypothetical protein JOZ19_17270 [Rubrobacter sp.]|nr:hypothetical protein [Rubrobacter sp.]